MKTCEDPNISESNLKIKWQSGIQKAANRKTQPPSRKRRPPKQRCRSKGHKMMDMSLANDIVLSFVRISFVCMYIIV